MATGDDSGGKGDGGDDEGEGSKQEYGSQFPQLLLHLAFILTFLLHFLRISFLEFPSSFFSHQEGSLSLHVSDSTHNCTTKDLIPWWPTAKEKLSPKLGAAHSAPFQPSPYESLMFRVHFAPSATTNGKLKASPYGAPPLSMVSSEQLRLQLTSSVQ